MKRVNRVTGNDLVKRNPRSLSRFRNDNMVKIANGFGAMKKGEQRSKTLE